MLFEPASRLEPGLASWLRALKQLDRDEAVQVCDVPVEVVFPLEGGAAVGASVAPRLMFGVTHHVFL